MIWNHKPNTFPSYVAFGWGVLITATELKVEHDDDDFNVAEITRRYSNCGNLGLILGQYGTIFILSHRVNLFIQEHVHI